MHTRVAASAGTFSKAVRWSDGVRLEVSAIDQGKTSGKGRGAQPGEPLTTFGLELTNGSGKTVDATAVVVTTTYAVGSSHRIARRVYTDNTTDFGARVKAGANTTATYAFSIPTKRLSAVTLNVDLDARHAPAHFSGAAR